MPRSPARLGLGPQVSQRIGVGRVSRLGLFGLGQPEVVEEDFLELLGAGEVHLAPGCRPRAVARGFDVSAQFGGQVVEDARVRSDADGFHLGEQAGERHFHVGQQLNGSAVFERPAKGVGQRVQRGCQAARAHLGGGGPFADLSQVEEGVGISGFLLDGQAKQAREHVVELV